MTDKLDIIEVLARRLHAAQRELYQAAVRENHDLHDDAEAIPLWDDMTEISRAVWRATVVRAGLI